MKASLVQTGRPSGGPAPWPCAGHTPLPITDTRKALWTSFTFTFNQRQQTLLFLHPQLGQTEEWGVGCLPVTLLMNDEP